MFLIWVSGPTQLPSEGICDKLPLWCSSVVLLGEAAATPVFCPLAPNSPGTVLGAHTAVRMDLLPSQPCPVRDKDTEPKPQVHSRVGVEMEHSCLGTEAHGTETVGECTWVRINFSKSEITVCNLETTWKTRPQGHHYPKVETWAKAPSEKAW